MKYVEYNASINEKIKKIGLLGECHIYNKTESQFAKIILSNYNNIAMEGTGKKASGLGIIGLLHLPAILALMTATGRFPTEETKSAIQIAKEENKNIFYLESDKDKTKTFMQHVAFAASGLISIPLSPFIYYYTKKKDPFSGETKGFEEKNKGLIRKILTHGGSANIKERTDIMNQRSYKQINKDNINDLLIICGQSHFNYMNNFLNNNLDLKEISKKII